MRRHPHPEGVPAIPPSKPLQGSQNRNSYPNGAQAASRTVSFFSTRPLEKGQQVSNLGPEGDRVFGVCCGGGGAVQTSTPYIVVTLGSTSKTQKLRIASVYHVTVPPSCSSAH